jgi:hypothetical protein
MRITAAAWLSACLAILPAARARAQAWLPPGGSVNVGFVFNDTFNRQHYLPNGGTIDVGHTHTYIDSLVMSYAPSSRFLLAATVPFVRARYIGTHPHKGSTVDDGQYHSTITDLRLQLHYQWLEEPFALAPYIGIVRPLRDYPTLGHATAGRGLNEEFIGFYVAKSLDEWLPRTYVQARYAYSFVEKRAGVSHDQSNADFELGCFPNGPRWSVRAVAYWQNTYGGIDVPVAVSSPLYPYHDQLARERYVQIGGGVAWTATRRLNTYALYKHSVSGADGHRLNDGFTLGFGYTLRRGVQ